MILALLGLVDSVYYTLIHYGVMGFGSPYMPMICNHKEGVCQMLANTDWASSAGFAEQHLRGRLLPADYRLHRHPARIRRMAVSQADPGDIHLRGWVQCVPGVDNGLPGPRSVPAVRHGPGDQHRARRNVRLDAAPQPVGPPALAPRAPIPFDRVATRENPHKPAFTHCVWPCNKRGNQLVEKYSWVRIRW